MEEKIKALEVKISDADALLDEYKREPIYSKKMEISLGIDEILEQISEGAGKLLEIERKEPLSEESSRRWRRICELQNEAARIRRGIIYYFNKTAV
jgi:hypothetical protein